MAKTYRRHLGTRLINSLFRALTETYKVEETGAEDAIPVLRRYISEIRVTRAYFDATPDSSDDAVAAERSRHAVFRLIPAR